MWKIAGVFLSVTGGVLAGSVWRETRKRAICSVDQICRGLLLMEGELCLDHAPLPQLMEGLSQHTEGAAKKLFSQCCEALDQLDTCPFRDGWRSSVADLDEISPDGRTILSPLGDILGRYDPLRQQQAVSAVRMALLDLNKFQEERLKRMGGTCCVLGASAGAVAAILLF